MQIKVQIVNAFIDGTAGGNPAGIVVDADSLTKEQKLEIAKKVGLSETAFVSKSKIATVKLEFFTPNLQVPHCGHAAIATFSLLRQLGVVGEGQLSKETIDGVREIVVQGEMTFMEQKAPRYKQVSVSSELGAQIVASLGITPEQLVPGIDPWVVNTGNSFLLIPLTDEACVSALQPDLKLIESISEELDLIGYYAFSTHTKVKSRHAGARMFAPRFKIPEESATGTAAGPLGCFLNEKLAIPQSEILIEQGWLMNPPSPSVIKVKLEFDNGKISRLMAGGKARAISTKLIDI